MSNEGLDEQLEEEIRIKYPNWTDAKIAKELLKVKKKLTMFNDRNKKAKKPKKEKIK